MLPLAPPRSLSPAPATSNMEQEGEARATRAVASSSECVVDAKSAMLMRMEKRMNLKASLRANNLDKAYGKRSVRFATGGRAAGSDYGASRGQGEQIDKDGDEDLDLLNAAWTQAGARREEPPVRLDESF